MHSPTKLVRLRNPHPTSEWSAALFSPPVIVIPEMTAVALAVMSKMRNPGDPSILCTVILTAA
jgi:hypothetical protein